MLLCVDSADVPPPDDPDEFHDHQLVGLAAVDPAGEPTRRGGPRSTTRRRPTCSCCAGRTGGTALVPFVTAIVPEVDLAGGRVVVDPPEGLLDL